MLKSFCVCCHLFFCTQDPWSWTVAILQDSMPSVITHRLHICLNAVRSFWARCRLFLDCGHTPGQHAQCHNPPATHIHKFIVCWVHGCWPLLPMYAGVHGLTTMLPQHLHYHFFQGDSGATHVLAWGISWVKQKFDHLALTLPPTPDASHISNAHAGSRARVTSMGGLYDAATLHALAVADRS